ncbi:hypothetical protein WOLCODRAFT_105754 [Wolfiporia cocos MD-104 SS10]|uniref:C2H2-type domain-containing protein n=1 Tax=Wolfiporia cocos (strain MD-104) TaxID=742152 RepID=A0A2H3JRR6_WOLCO|nr:hypothetical protein WOLCODRAFT_105754 [Wolfiporia cocos MD-104 SS10]
MWDLPDPCLETIAVYLAIDSTQPGYGQQVVTSQYPASPQRPFACDMCALSFNWQHDLKRRRDTRTGEKPFQCNGGCGKTFTRKDALKRHRVCGRIKNLRSGANSCDAAC